MLKMTERTVVALRELALPPEPLEVRIFSETGNGDSLKVELVEQPAADDRIVEQDGVRLHLDADAASALEEMLLDAVVDDDELRLAIRERS